MGYKASRARREFDAWIVDALVLVQASRELSSQARVVKEGILCASLFLTHARFENFFRDIVSFAIQKLNRRSLSCKELPGRLRAAQLLSEIPHSHFKHYYVNNNERALVDSLHETLAKSDWWWASSRYTGDVNPRVVLGQKCYPSSENLKSVFYKLGIDVFAECGRELRMDVAATIDGISDLREEMAHLGMPSQITDSDIEHKIEVLKKIVRAIDKIVSEHVSNCLLKKGG